MYLLVLQSASKLNVQSRRVLQNQNIPDIKISKNCDSNFLYDFYSFSEIFHRRFDRYAENALTCVNSHQTTPNLMKNLNLNFPHECDNIYSVPLVNDDFTLNLAFFMSFTRFLSFFVEKINKHLKLSEKSETPQAHIPTLRDHSQKFAAQSESLKCSFLEKEPFTDMIDVGPHMDRPNQHEVSQVFSDKISHV